MSPIPHPVEQALPGYLPQGQESNAHMNTISLGVLIDFIIQRTYHDITVLAELLPRQTDMERKIEVYDFSSRTRLLFIRLLALVKWANSVSKVDKSSNIISFLDKQNMLFVETADMLVRMARETLVRACLPHFNIPAAVEVLTTGSYNRMPVSIRECLVPSNPITPQEKRQTLMRLNQVIQHRLVTGKLMPEMSQFKITNGRVTFEVKNEFHVTLTVMGDTHTLPWRLLNTDILVEDKEIGEGRCLVHSLQVLYIQRLIQARLAENPNDLSVVYHCLHYFCQSLQLEVLYTQALRLTYDRLDDNIHIDEYIPGVKVTVSYWRTLPNILKFRVNYRLTVQTDTRHASHPLIVIHTPPLGVKESLEIADRSVHSEQLSMERLIVHTIYIRTISRLTHLKLDFKEFLSDVDFSLQGTPAVLIVPILTPCLRAEQIHITIDTHTGLFRCHVPKHLDCPIMVEMQKTINGDRTRLSDLTTELRYWITKKRCEKTLQHLPARIDEDVRFLTGPNRHDAKPNHNEVIIQLNRHRNLVIVVNMKEKCESTNEMEYIFHVGLLSHQYNQSDNISPDHIQLIPFLQSGNIDEYSTNFQQCGRQNLAKIFPKIIKMMKFDTFTLTHGAYTGIDDFQPSKTKFMIDWNIPPSKQGKTIYPAYFIPELAHVVTTCDEKIPFMNLDNALEKYKITTHGMQIESKSAALFINILSMPLPSSSDCKKKYPIILPHVWEDLKKSIVSIVIRSQTNKNNQMRVWGVEYTFREIELPGLPQEENNQRTLCQFYDQTNNYEVTVEEILCDWSKIVYLYTLVYNLLANIEKGLLIVGDTFIVTSYTFMNLILAYGPQKELTCNIYWSTKYENFQMMFMGGIAANNGHSLIGDLLVAQLNSQCCLAGIIDILNNTSGPFTSIAKLPVIPQLGVPRPQVPVLSFCVIPHSTNMLRLIYYATYILDICLLPRRMLCIRDGAHSRFDQSLFEDITPIQSLKSFLAKFSDESITFRGWANSEDDNPLSPIAVEDNFGGQGSISSTVTGGSSPFLSVGIRAPQSPRDSTLRFPTPIVPSGSSNSLTSVSPLIQTSGNPSSTTAGVTTHPNYNITSPPSSHMTHQSPSGLLPLSPLNAQPSPHMVHSPGPNSLYMQGHQDSPFTALSPANTNWPGSPSMPRPSPRTGQSPDKCNQASSTVQNNIALCTASVPFNRILQFRSWTGSVPTILTQEKFDLLCRPSPHPNKDINCKNDISSLERFLGCAYMRRQLQRNIQNEESLTALNCMEPGMTAFKVDCFQCQVTLNPVHMQSLHLKITQLPPTTLPDGKQSFQLSPDDMLVIEQFFDLRVVIPPYRPNNISAFCRLLASTPHVLKDFVQIMRLDIKPDLGGESLKWAVKLCMRVPPSAAPIVPIGSPAVLMVRLKILFFIEITRIPYNGKEWKDSTKLVLPMVYDLNSNITQLAEKRDQPQLPWSIPASTLLRRFSEYGVQHGQCSLFPAVRELLTNLQLPNDIPQPNQTIGPPVVTMVGTSSSTMLHSPMQQISGAVPSQIAPGYTQIPQNAGPQ